MIILLAITIGVLYTIGFYMIMRRSFVKVILGIIFLGHAANLLIFTIGRVSKGVPAFLADGTATTQMADPLPQALVLTAIVIGFGVQAFTLVLFKRTYKVVKTDDLNELNTTDRI